MLRTIGETLVLFLVPFALYGAFLVVQTANPFEVGQWTRRVIVPLALVGLLFAIGGIAIYGVRADRHAGGYRPARIENGRIVPGEMQ